MVFGRVRRPRWGQVEVFWKHVGYKLWGLGATLGYLGVKLEVLGASWLRDGGLGVILGPGWGFGSYLGSKMGDLGSILAPGWEVLGVSWGSWPET